MTSNKRISYIILIEFVMECAICLGNILEVKNLECCSHSFCVKCLDEWLAVRTVCPLCSSQVGPDVRNQLEPDQREFNHEFATWDVEVGIINNKVAYLSERVSEKNFESKNFKNQFPSSHLTFLNDQISLLFDYHESLAESAMTKNQEMVGLYTQLASELIMSIEGVLSGAKEVTRDIEPDLQVEEGNDSSDEEYEYYQKHFNKKEKMRQQKKVLQNNGKQKKTFIN